MRTLMITVIVLGIIAYFAIVGRLFIFKMCALFTSEKNREYQEQKPFSIRRDFRRLKEKLHAAKNGK